MSNTTVTPDPQRGFRLSQLLYDTRYRSMTIQVIAFILVMGFISWLGMNLVTNLQAQGKDFNFGFLNQTAGFDINQRLIEYDSQSTHMRAAVVGMLNTLLVAFLGCILATIIGVTAGVLRLSKNWLVSSLMAVYVEGFRNVPLLLWMIVILALTNESAPKPRAFKTGDASMWFGDTVAVTNRGTYIPGVEFASPLGSSGMTWLVIVGLLLCSFFATRWVSSRAVRVQEATGARPATWYWNLLIWVAPVALALVLSGAHLVYPELKGFNFKGGVHLRNSLIALWLALSLYTGAFIAENVRAGILAVSKGQTEAAFALGLPPRQTTNLVILPQAMRVIIPPLISQYLNLTKNSSLAVAVTYMDMRQVVGTTINQTGRELEGMLIIGGFYLLTSLIIAAGMNWYNERVKLKER